MNDDLLWQQTRLMDRRQIRAFCATNRHYQDFCQGNKNRINMHLMEREFGIPYGSRPGSLYKDLLAYEWNRTKFYKFSAGSEEDAHYYQGFVGAQSRESAARRVAEELATGLLLNGMYEAPSDPVPQDRTSWMVEIWPVVPRDFGTPYIMQQTDTQDPNVPWAAVISEGFENDWGRAYTFQLADGTVRTFEAYPGNGDEEAPYL